MALLVLFDVDGTLFLTHDPLMGEATIDAVGTVWGHRPVPNAIDEMDHAGQTALSITRAILRREGLSDAEIDSGLGRWCSEASSRYLHLIARADTRAWRSPEGTAETVSRIQHRALLTGNPEPVARARMKRLGLDELFPQGQGAFGCEAEDRATLIGLARERAGSWPADATVAVGDTPADIAGARAAGIHVVAFASGRKQRDALVAADATIERMAELPTALTRLSGAT
ncbi:MAG TPA: HAD family hydrolase [Gaiellaceae bacterium]|nr:HAD family hydrolase [Gaiellaceae bacterium]